MIGKDETFSLAKLLDGLLLSCSKPMAFAIAE
jgi:hypothetical protein